MSPAGADRHAVDAEAGLRELEGYLLWQAEVGRARTRAEAFAARMPWLTTAQREEVVRLYTAEHLRLSRQYLETVAARCHALRGEYTARFAKLRRRVVRRATAACAAGLSLSVTLLCLLTLARR
ncbi:MULTISPECIES: hypothetical protein [Streptomyces]|uniref:hypothetical protein n=1 Tax=Streptomyces TaxID=1883 RepID=UPI0022493D11|nr:hypothetical protein [Streptomyces sp. JHD 1]MCX2970458.1 hypothetical protein [Streptomyces sp. JHD 1]